MTPALPLPRRPAQPTRRTAGWRAAAAAILGAILLAAGLPPAARAQAPGAPGAAGADRQGFAWVAAKGDRRLLLLATVHAATPLVRSLPPDIDDWIGQASAVAIEADVTQADQLQALVERHGLIPAAEPDLWATLSPPLRQRAQDLVRRAGSAPDAVARLKPWLLTVTLATAELQRAGFSPDGGSEGRLLERARQRQRPVLELEGAEAQILAFDSAPPAVQVRYLQQMLDTIDDGSAHRDIDELTRAWVRRDAAAMEAIVVRTHRESSRSEAHRFIAQDLLVNRHPAMLDAMERFSARHATLLVAVGALHWFGPGNLLEGLRGRGWVVSPQP